MKVLAWSVVSVVGLFAVIMMFGTKVSPEMSKLYNKEAAANDMCNKMMSDSALGDERRMTRDMCDNIKAHIKEQMKAERKY